MNLHLKDKMILYELGINSRQTTRELAKKLNLSKSTVNYRIQQFFKKGIIIRYKSYINAKGPGTSSFALYLKLQHTDEDMEKEMRDYFGSIENITWLGFSYGNWEVIIEFYVSSLYDLNHFIKDILTRYAACIKNKELVQYVYGEYYGLKFIPKKNYEKIVINYVGRESMIDPEEQKVLSYIEGRPDYSLRGISQDLDLSLDTARKIIKRFYKDGFIAGDSIVVDLSTLGYSWHIVQLSINDYTIEQELYRFLNRHPSVFYVIKYLGRWDFEIGLCIIGGVELQTFINDLKQQFHNAMQNYEFSLITNISKYA